jgi:LruC domain-containing protein
MPWALNIPAPFSYPKEKSKINEAYLNFNAWVRSCGVQNTDWYLNKNGYRNNDKIFVKP